MNPLIYIGIALIVLGVVYFFWSRRLKTLEGTIDKLESSIIDTDDVNFKINEAITKQFQITVELLSIFQQANLHLPFQKKESWL